MNVELVVGQEVFARHADGMAPQAQLLPGMLRRLAPGLGRRGHPISGYHVLRPGARRLRCREKPDAARNDLLGHASSPTGCLWAFSLFTMATLPRYASTAYARYAGSGSQPWPPEWTPRGSAPASQMSPMSSPWRPPARPPPPSAPA